MRQAAVCDDYPAPCDRGADARKTQTEQQMSVKRLGIQWRERHIVRDDDIGQLPPGEHAARFAEQAIADASIVLQQNLASFHECDRRVAVIGALVQVHGACLGDHVRGNAVCTDADSYAMLEHVENRRDAQSIVHVGFGGVH